MDTSAIAEILQERQKAFGYKNIAPIQKALDDFLALNPTSTTYHLGDTITIGTAKDLDATQQDALQKALLALKPWRKGPFAFFDTFINTEWQSQIKYNLIEKHLDIKDKCVLDIGCNNGYYLFRMLEKSPKTLIGFDPSPLYFLQFKLAQTLLKCPITYELLGVEHTKAYTAHHALKPDVVLLLGVLYHRSDPVGTLKTIAQSLQKGAQILLDCFYIDGDEAIALCPKDTYSKIPNVYFVPTITTLHHWLSRAGFEDTQVIATTTTTTNEQRKTEWIDTQSLEDFIDPHTGLTTEGYPRPKRCYLKSYRK